MSKAGLGRTFSEETRKKLSEIKRGKTYSEETSRSDVPDSSSRETRKKMSDAKQNISEETRKKISAALTGENHPFFGKTHSPETIQKMREVKIGKVTSESTKNKISNALTGKTLSESTKEKISQSCGTTVFVYSLNLQCLYTFPTPFRSFAAKHLNCSHMTIVKYAKSGKAPPP